MQMILCAMKQLIHERKTNFQTFLIQSVETIFETSNFNNDKQ